MSNWRLLATESHGLNCVSRPHAEDVGVEAALRQIEDVVLGLDRQRHASPRPDADLDAVFASLAREEASGGHLPPTATIRWSAEFRLDLILGELIHGALRQHDAVVNLEILLEPLVGRRDVEGDAAAILEIDLERRERQLARQRTVL